MLYEVSDEGRVRNGKTGKLLHPKLDHSGYCRVWLCAAKGNDRCFLVHCLIAAAFIGCADPRGCDVDHINGVKSDNRPTNLQYLRRGDHNRKTHGKPVTRVREGGACVTYPTRAAAAAAEHVAMRTIMAALAAKTGEWVDGPAAAPPEPCALGAPSLGLTDEEVDSVLGL